MGISLLTSSFMVLFMVIAGIKFYEWHKKQQLIDEAGTFEKHGEAGRSLETARIRITKENRQRGIDGERAIGSELERLAAKYGLVVLHDLSIPGSNANIDHLVIAKKAVFIIDSKNFSGLIEIKKNRQNVNQLYVDGYNQWKIVKKLSEVSEDLRKYLRDGGYRPHVVPMLAFKHGNFKTRESQRVGDVIINVYGVEFEFTKYGTGRGYSYNTVELAQFILESYPIKE